MREALNAGAQATLESGDTYTVDHDAAFARQGILTVAASRPVAPPEVYVPPPIAPLPPGATSAPEPIDMDRMRQRGQVSGFIRSGGVDWTGQGPNPLNPGCKVRPDVMAEFRDTLRALQGQMDDINAERAAMRAAGVPV